MGTSTYFLDIASAEKEKVFAHAYGDLDVINYIARRQIADLSGGTFEVSVRLVETEEIGQLDGDGNPNDVKRIVTTFTGEADDAAVLLKRKLVRERAERNGSAGQEQAGEDESGPLVAEQAAS